MKVQIDGGLKTEWKKRFKEEVFKTTVKQVKDLKHRAKWKREFGSLFIAGKKVQAFIFLLIYTIIPTIIAPIIAKTMPVCEVPSELDSTSERVTVGSSVCPSTTRKLVLQTSGLNTSSDDAKIFNVFAPTSRCEVSSSVRIILDELLSTGLTLD